MSTVKVTIRSVPMHLQPTRYSTVSGCGFCKITMPFSTESNPDFYPGISLADWHGHAGEEAAGTDCLKINRETRN